MINKAFPMETTENHISGWEKSTSDGPEPKTLPSVDTYWSVLKRGKDLVGLKLRKQFCLKKTRSESWDRAKGLC